MEYDLWVREEELHPAGNPDPSDKDSYYPAVTCAELQPGDTVHVGLEGTYRGIEVTMQVITVDRSEDVDTSQCLHWRQDKNHWKDATHCRCFDEMALVKFQAAWAKRLADDAESQRKTEQYRIEWERTHPSGCCFTYGNMQRGET